MCDLYTDVHDLTQKFVKKNKQIDYNLLIINLQLILDDLALLQFPTWHKDLAYGELMYSTFTKKVLLLPEKVISGFGTEELLHNNHFIIQNFRIPYKETPNLFNLLKIAIYTALLSSIKVKELPDGIVKAYKDLKMHNLINYISRQHYTQLMEKMPHDISKRITSGLVDTLIA